MTEVVDIAVKIGQAGTVVILVFFVIGLTWAIKILFSALQENTMKLFDLSAQTVKVTESHTRAVEENSRSSESNKQSIMETKLVMESILRQLDIIRDRK